MSAEEAAAAAAATRGTDPIVEEPSSTSLFANCCFPCFGSRANKSRGPSFWERVGSSHHKQGGPRWWVFRGLGKLREWSEIVAGPKWKTFIRRFNRNGNSHNRHGKFQYDPLDYALNFDEGSGQNGDFDEEDGYAGYGGGFRNFSARFASFPGSVNSASSAVDVAKLSPVRDVPVLG